MLAEQKNKIMKFSSGGVVYSQLITYFIISDL